MLHWNFEFLKIEISYPAIYFVFIDEYLQVKVLHTFSPLLFFFFQNPVASSYSWSEIDVLILAGTIGHVLSLGASSFIEEEHQTWYFLINTLCLLLCQELCRNNFLLKECDPQHSTNVKQNFDSIGESSKCKNIDIPAASNSKLGKATSSSEFIKGSDKWISLATPWIILICCRLLRSLNQTGVQWAHRPDFGHWLTRLVSDLLSHFLPF